MDLIRATLRHNGCWSRFLKDFTDVKGELLTQNVNHDNIVGTVAFYSNSFKSRQHFSKFFRAMKKESTIKEINQIGNYGNNNVRLINFVATRKNSMSGFVFENSSFMFKEFFYKGYELWYFAPFVPNLVQIKAGLSEIADIIDFEKIPVDRHLTMFSVLREFVNDRYKDLLSFVYENGYFEYPHKMTIEETARVFKTTKSNVSRKLRNIEKEVFATYYKGTEATRILEKAVEQFERRHAEDIEK